MVEEIVMIRKILLFQIFGWSFFVLSLISAAITLSDFFFTGLIFLDLFSFSYISIFFLVFSMCSFVVAHVLKSELEAGREHIDLVFIITKYSGQLTPMEFASETGFSFQEAKKKLDSMHRAGVCTIFLTSSGVAIYSFPEFEGLNQVVMH